jgi:hypothetical protein
MLLALLGPTNHSTLGHTTTHHGHIYRGNRNPGARLARSIIENRCWESLDRIFREAADLWT